MINPKASTDRDFKLAMALREYDSPNQHTTIYHLKEGNQFALDNGRIFTKIKNSNHFFKDKEKDLTSEIEKYLKEKTALI